MAQGNLAGNLTASAERFGDRVAQRLDDAEVTYASLDGASARVAGLLAAKGVGPGDRVGIMLPNVPYFAAVYYGILRLGAVVVPMNVLLKGREVSFYLRDPEAKVVFAWHGFAEAAQRGAAEAGAECVLVEPGGFEELLAGAEPRQRGAGPRTGRHRRHPLHVRDHRDAEGRRAHARQPRPQRRDRRRPVRHRRGRRRPRSAPALPLLRPDVRPERLRPRRRRADPHPALRPRQGARDHRARPGHRVRGRADDVLRHAAEPRGRDRGHVEPARLRVGRGGAARRGAPRLRGEVRLQGARGLRAERDLAGGVLQPPRPRAQAGLDRHADRGRGDEGRQRGGRGPARRRGGRDRHPRPQRHEGLLGPAGRDGRGDPRRLVPHGRPRRASTTRATSTSSTARRT